MDTTYVLSLDALDLSVLPFTYQPRRHITPLWSGHRNDDLCEFQIRTTTPLNEQSVTDKSTKFSKRQSICNQTIETTMCHMCKVDVPKRFLKEHKNSSKHSTYTKIANIALQRIKDYIHDEGDSDKSEFNGLSYFCAHCVAVVNNNEKSIHENSLSHKNAVFFDKYLSNFVDIYKTVDDNDNDEKDSFKPVTATKCSEKNENEDNHFDLKKYLKMLKDKYKMAMKFQVIEEERLEIDIKGSIVEVAIENFHGFKITNNKYIECVVCKTVFEVRDKVEHIMSAKHMYRVSTPLKDINCKREIYPLWHHCVLCNVIIDNYKMHTSDSVHQGLLQKALKYKSRDNFTQYSLFSQNSENNPSDIQWKNEATVNNLMKMPLASVSVAGKDFNQYIMEKTEAVDLVNCLVCDILIPKDEEHVSTHIKGVNHIEQYAKLLQNHHLVLQNGNMYCYICKVFVGLKGEIIHVRSKKHLKFLENIGGEPNTSLSLEMNRN